MKNYVKLISILVVALMLFSILGGCGCSKKEDPASSGNAFTADANVITDKESAEAARKAAENAPPPMSIVMEYRNDFSFASGKAGTEGAGYVANSKPNLMPMYITITVEEEEIVRTGLMPVGGMIETFKLVKDVKPGTYDGTLVFHAVDEKKQEEIASSMSMVVTVMVS